MHQWRSKDECQSLKDPNQLVMMVATLQNSRSLRFPKHQMSRTQSCLAKVDSEHNGLLRSEVVPTNYIELNLMTWVYFYRHQNRAIIKVLTKAAWRTDLV